MPIIVKTSKRLDMCKFWTGVSWSDSVADAYRYHTVDYAKAVLDDLSMDYPKAHLKINQLYWS